MRVGIDISQSVYVGTGVAAYTRNLVKSLIKFSGNEFVLFGSAFGRQNSLLNLINEIPKTSTVHAKIYGLPPSVLAFLWNRLHVGSVEKFTGGLDLFHTSDWTEPPSKVPKVTTIHDLIVYKYPEHFPEEIISNQKAKLAWVKKESRAIIADSKNTKADIINYLGINHRKIHVVYLGVGDEYFQQKVDEVVRVKKKYHITGDYILSIGTREPRKNLPNVVKAFQRLNDESLSLVIGGSFGWGEDLGKTKNVKIVGFVDQKDMPALYTGAVCFVYPSLYEGFGLPVLEALACGLPVVTSNRGSLGEIADKIAIEVNPDSVEDIAEGIAKVLHLSKQEKKSLSLKGIKHAAQFSWEQTAINTIKVYKSII